MSNVIDLSILTPLFSKEGWREILQNAIKIPLYKGGLERDNILIYVYSVS